jgi:NADP-dependent 3-hydroxy acid dehydrogenase YdfG
MPDAQRFENKIVLVTGGGSGIGRAASLRFAEEGAAVVIPDQNLDAARRVVIEIQTLGREGYATQADVTRPEDCERMVREAVEHFGHLDVVFANAGISGGAPVMEMEPADWDRVIATNLRGVFLTDKFALPALIENGGGAIVNGGLGCLDGRCGLHGEQRRCDRADQEPRLAGRRLWNSRQCHLSRHHSDAARAAARHESAGMGIAL